MHRKIAKKIYAKLGIFDEDQFDEVAWGTVWEALKEAPRMFQIWASKQVTDMAGVNNNLAKHKPKQSKNVPAVTEQLKPVTMCSTARKKAESRTLGILSGWWIDG